MLLEKRFRRFKTFAMPFEIAKHADRQRAAAIRNKKIGVAPRRQPVVETDMLGVIHLCTERIAGSDNVGPPGTGRDHRVFWRALDFVAKPDFGACRARFFKQRFV